MMNQTNHGSVADVHEIADDDPGRTAWGVRPVLVHHLALKRYRVVLRAIGDAGETAVLVLCVLMVLMFGLLVFGTNFENYLFLDGTAMTCGYDGDSDQVFWIDPNRNY